MYKRADYITPWYLRLASSEAILFAPGQTKLPSWFIKSKWDKEFQLFKRSLFKNDSVGLVDYQDISIKVKISSLGRAMMECLSLCPDDFSLAEAYDLMEGLSTLRPEQVQELLEECTSIKVKRLFLYFAERAGHSWFKYIDQTKINLGSGNRRYRIYNIGSSSPVRLMDYIETLEKVLGKKAAKEFLPMQPGDVLNTYCDVSDLEKEFGYRPSTTLEEGLKAFAEWYKSYYQGSLLLIQ